MVLDPIALKDLGRPIFHSIRQDRSREWLVTPGKSAVPTKNSPSRRIIGTDTPEPTATAQAHIAGRRGRSFPKVMTAGVSTNAPELGRHSLVLARGTSHIQRKNGPRCRIVIKFGGQFMRFSDTEDDAPPHAPKSKSGSSFSATMAFTSCWLYKWLRVSLIA
jgi:hypothetical protein